MLPVYWINLEQSVERRNNMLTQFLANGIQHRRIDAIKHEKPILGCCLSHIKAIHTAWLENCEIALICEDDVDFSGGQKNFKLIETVLSTMPAKAKADWDIIQIQYTEPNFTEGLRDYLVRNNVIALENRLIKGYLYGSVAYIINRRGMTKFLNRMTLLSKEDLSKYTVTATFDHPRAGAEELIYRYVNTYITLFPILNYQHSESLVNTAQHYTENHNKNMEFTNQIQSMISLDNYKLKQGFIYEIEYDLHWFNDGRPQVDKVINEIFT